jgi:hypothetical protein
MSWAEKDAPGLNPRAGRRHNVTCRPGHEIPKLLLQASADAPARALLFLARGA